MILKLRLNFFEGSKNIKISSSTPTNCQS